MSHTRRISCRFTPSRLFSEHAHSGSSLIGQLARPAPARFTSFSCCPSVTAFVGLFCLAAGCTLNDRTTATVAEPSVTGEFAAFDGRDGTELTFAEVVQRCRAADVIFFGEEHNNRVCNELQWRLLTALSQSWPRTTLAMEFFESDTQADLDLYLRGRIDETAFLERTRQGKGYADSHRPLIELCKRQGIPVVAANAPRRFVREFRRSGEDYHRYRSALKPTEFRWLPRQFTYVSGEYRDRFMEITKGHPTVDTSPPGSTPTRVLTDDEKRERGFLAQLLWDNSMSESLADRRWTHPGERVMLIVGGFHIERGGATATIFRWRRTQDRVCTILYRSGTSTDFDDDDRGAADVVLYGHSREVRPEADVATPDPTPAQPAQTETVIPLPTESPAPDQTAPISDGVVISTPADSSTETSENDAATTEVPPPNDSKSANDPQLMPVTDDSPVPTESGAPVASPDTTRSFSDTELLEKPNDAPPLEPVAPAGAENSNTPTPSTTEPPLELPPSSSGRSGESPTSQPSSSPAGARD